MSDCPLSAAEVRTIIGQLETLEKWLLEQESKPANPGQAASSTQVKGYRRGGAAERAKVALSSKADLKAFPGIAPIAAGFSLVKEAGKDFKELWGDLPYRGLEEGPGPIPEFLEDQADFCSVNPVIGVQRLHVAFAAGFWARIALETNTPQTFQIRLSEPSKFFVVLRAQGLGGYIQFAAEEDFEAFRGRVSSGGLVAHGFVTESEVSIFCYSARIAVPPTFKL